jgi:hypothetical protein
VDTRTRRHRASLLATILSGAMLLAGAIPAFAGDTRNVFVGSPGTGGGDGVLTFTEVSTGGATKTDVRIANDSNATMNKTTLSIGIAPADFLPAGVTIKAIFGPDRTATNCPIAADKLSATCSFGNLAAGKEKNISVLFGISTPGDKAISMTVKVKETVNDNGANKDTFVAAGTAAVNGASCDAAATYTQPNTAETVTTEAAGCFPQSTTLKIPSNLTNGAEVQIGESTDAACDTGYTCFGAASNANVNDGAPVKLEWTVTWSTSILPNNFNLKKFTALHFEDDGDIIKIANTNQGKCGNNLNATNCLVSVTISGDTLVAIFRTPTNGKIKGAF